MKNLAGHPESSMLCAEELKAAGIPIEALSQPYGEPKSLVGGKLGKFTFRRAWVYWCVSGDMPRHLAHELNTSPRESESGTTWGDVIRVDGFAGGTSVDHDGCSSWHIDTPDGLTEFARFVRAHGLDWA